MPLTDADKPLLEKVLNFAGDREDQIREGVIRALVGVNDQARRNYLWGELTRLARERIRRAVAKVAARRAREAAAV